MNAPLQLRLLGTPQVTFNGRPVSGFDSRKALALLCYLAARGESVSRTHLADLFWGDKPETKGRANLSRVLHNLNGLFPGAFLATRDTLQLNPGVFAVDSAEFESMTVFDRPQIPADEKSFDRLSAAAHLYRDEFMAGMFLDDCPDFELWLVQERERWRQRVITVLERLSTYYTESGEYDKALPHTARMLDLEPWREEAHRRMMFLLARTGQRSAALQQFETAQRVLGEELNIEPSAEMVALYKHIRAEQLTPFVSAPHNLPIQLTTFLGRETDLARIAARLNNPDCRLLTLVGVGGIGKTRLALEAARNLLNSFHDGVYFTPLAPIGVGQTDFIIPTIVKSIGLSILSNQEPKRQLLNFLSARQILLVLDNFEHLLEGAVLVNEILEHASNVKILVTSREPLDLQSEWIIRVTGLSYPTTLPQHLAELAHYGAVQLFVERASRIDEQFTLNVESTPYILRILQSIEGMPLAIELAVTGLGVFSVSELQNRFRETWISLQHGATPKRGIVVCGRCWTGVLLYYLNQRNQFFDVRQYSQVAGRLRGWRPYAYVTSLNQGRFNSILND